MWISIQTKRWKLSSRSRRNIETHVRRALRREGGQIGSVVLTIGPIRLEGEPGFRCRLRVWSHNLGLIKVSAFDHTMRTTTQQATARARHAIRRRVDKRLSRLQRVKGRRLDRWLTDSALG